MIQQPLNLCIKNNQSKLKKTKLNPKYVLKTTLAQLFCHFHSKKNLEMFLIDLIFGKKNERLSGFF